MKERLRLLLIWNYQNRWNTRYYFSQNENIRSYIQLQYSPISAVST